MRTPRVWRIKLRGRIRYEGRNVIVPGVLVHDPRRIVELEIPRAKVPTHVSALTNAGKAIENDLVALAATADLTAEKEELKSRLNGRRPTDDYDEDDL